MVSASLLILITLIYLAILFYIAYAGDNKPVGQFSRYQPLIFTLSLTVYCSSWTFFGAVGRAAVSGWEFFSIYLGPILLFVFFTPFIKKLIAVSKRNKTTSIADFISSRYGKNQSLAAIVTIISLVGTVPYIALQLKAVSSAFDLLSGQVISEQGPSILLDTAFYLGLILAVFAILFGARRIDASEHHRGIINAISVEAIIKIVSLLAIASLSYVILKRDTTIEAAGLGLTDVLFQPFKEEQLSIKFFTQMLLAAGAIICLPRQFHVAAVESRGNEMGFARWVFPLFLLLVSVSVIPITAAGLQQFSSAQNADLFILSLPMQFGSETLAIVSYLGGFSAATGMVIMAAVALGTMVSNDLILPVLLKFQSKQRKHNFYPTLLLIRRITIFVLLGLAYSYHRVALGDKSLSSIGLISFAAAIQFAPLIVGGLYWRRGHKSGAISGLLAGFTVWLYTLLLPTLATSEMVSNLVSSKTLFGFHFLQPDKLFGIEFLDPLTHGVFWSLSANIFFYILLSLRAKPSLTDRLQASAYVEGAQPLVGLNDNINTELTLYDLRELCHRFVGEDRASEFFARFELSNKPLKTSDLASVDVLKKAEIMLSGSVGSATAERILNTALGIKTGETGSYIDLLDQTSQAIHFNRELLQVTMDNITQGVSVVDHDLRLVAWNAPYLSLFDYPANFLKQGMPAEKIIAFNIERTLVLRKTASHLDEVSKRLGFLRSGSNYSYERTWKNGRIIQTQGNRLPDGGYVTTYTDITEMKLVQIELEQVNESLEVKVEQRTEILSRINKKLQEATESKARFLAGASHDLAQPLSAGKLYLGALLEDLKDVPKSSKLAENALSSLQSAESLLKALLDISKLDSGVLEPTLQSFQLQELLSKLETEFTVIAKQKGLIFKVVSTDQIILSDKNMLRRILQNFISNAIRYTQSGAVMVLARKRDGRLVIEVRDSGIGIDNENIDTVFDEFYQFDKNITEGLGLGLSISRRVSKLLNHPIGVRSTLGKGSVFYVSVPVSDKLLCFTDMVYEEIPEDFLLGLNVLCVDDEKDITEALSEVLKRWGANVSTASNYREYQGLIAKEEPFDIVLADYHLKQRVNGLDVLNNYRTKTVYNFMGVLITAAKDSKIEDMALLAEYQYLSKPIETQSLKRMLFNQITERAKNTVENEFHLLR